MTEAEREQRPRYIVGIDLGTTQHRRRVCRHGAGAPPARPPIETVRRAATGRCRARSRRTHSCRRFATTRARRAADADPTLGLATPMPELPRGLGGVARAGARQPRARAVGRERQELAVPRRRRSTARAILPWGAPDDVPKISPVDASASYLAHVRAAWDAAHPDAPLAAAGGRAHRAGLVRRGRARAHARGRAARRACRRVRLLEEPQAAFYDWLDRHHARADAQAALGCAQARARVRRRRRHDRSHADRVGAARRAARASRASPSAIT